MSKTSRSIKKSYTSNIVSSFVGALAALPLSLAVVAPLSNVGATDNTPLFTQADLAKFAYAYTQGLTASAVSATGPVGSCSEVKVDAQGVTAGAVAGAQTLGGGAPVVHGISTSPSGQGLGPIALKPGEKPAVPIYRLASEYVSPINNFQSWIYNSSSSNTAYTYTNSNNNVGSNNSTETSIEVEDSKKLSIDVNNNPMAMNTSASQSFNKGSYNSYEETNTSITNDSFKVDEDKTVIIDSGNVDNTAVTKTEVEHSYNNETENKTIASNNETEIASDNTLTENKTIASNNETEIASDNTMTTENTKSFNEGSAILDDSGNDNTVQKGGEVEDNTLVETEV